MKDIVSLSSSLSKASIKRYSNAFSMFDWPEAFSGADKFFPDSLISINGTAAFEKLPDWQKKNIGFFELINFFSLNIHGEKFLLSGMSDRLYKKFDREISRYMHHFIDEENKHMALFGKFCSLYHAVYPDKKPPSPPRHEKKFDSLLFFSKVVIFEEIVDHYNVAIAGDESVNDLVRSINRYHHEDEVRHLAFGRRIVSDLFDKNKDNYSESDRSFISDYLSDYFNATLREYFNPRIYRDAGLNDAFALYREAIDSTPFETRQQQLVDPCLSFFISEGIIQDRCESR